MSHTPECGLGFHDYKGSTFNEFSEGVQTGINDHPDKFPPADAPVSNLVLVALIATMLSDFSKYKKGGQEQKQTYLTSKGFVMEAIDKLIPWINKIANGDTKLIILAGYEPTYDPAAQKQSINNDAPQDVVVETGKSTGLMSGHCESYGVGHFYGCIVTVGQPLTETVSIDLNGQLHLPANLAYAIIHDFSHNRIKYFSGMTRGVDYYFYWYVVGVNGVTPLSKAVMMASI